MTRGKTPALAGQRFGFLTVLAREGSFADRRAAWRCQCRCGRTTLAATVQLLGGTKKSCGVGHNFVSFVRTVALAEYNIWWNIKSRCHNKRVPTYKNYGAKGVRLCARWHDFSQFLSDMGPRPSPKHSVDRFPNRRGNYEPGNCRWATYQQQARNTDQCVHIEIGGKLVPLVEVTEKLGISRRMVIRRLERGWSLGEALTVASGMRR